MIVYGELLFTENMIIGGVLLYLTGEICGRPPHCTRVRLLVGAIMCGAFSMTLFIPIRPPIRMLAMVVMEIIFALAVCTIVFGRKPAAHTITFVLVTYFMGGITMGLLLVTKNTGIHTAAGIYTGDMKAAALAVFIAIGTATTKQIVRTVKARKLYAETRFTATIICGENTFDVEALLDTGNRLKDPITAKPVAVASRQLWLRLQRCEPSRLRLIPYEAVGSKGLLEALKVDCIIIGDRRFDGCLIADGSDDIKRSGCDLLLAAEMAFAAGPAHGAARFDKRPAGPPSVERPGQPATPCPHAGKRPGRSSRTAGAGKMT